MSLRMMHKEEDSYLVYDHVPTGPLETHVVSKELIPSSASSPRTLWTVVQTYLTTSTMSVLDRGPVSGELGDLEVGGNGSWESLYLVKNLVNGEVLIFCKLPWIYMQKLCFYIQNAQN